MDNLIDHAWNSLRINKTDFFEGVYTFNGCKVVITKRQDPYRYETGTGKPSTMSARFWGKIVFPNGIEEPFEEERGGEIARRTGFSITDERSLFKKLGDKYILPYLRK